MKSVFDDVEIMTGASSFFSLSAAHIKYNNNNNNNHVIGVIKLEEKWPCWS